MDAKPKYRVRGLSEPSPASPAPKEVSIDAEAPYGQRSRPPFDAILRAIGRPRLVEFIHQAPLYELRRWWRGFDFFGTFYNPIKLHPVALAPHLIGDEVLFNEKPELKAIDRYAGIQLEEIRNISYVLTAAEKPAAPPPRDINSPVAAVLLLILFRGSADLRERKDELLKVIAESPVASYLLLQIGMCPKMNDRLITQILPDPWLTTRFCIAHRSVELISLEQLRKCLAATPYLLPIARFARGEVRDYEAWLDLMDLADVEPLAAALALGLHPTDQYAERWHELVMTSPEAIYWTQRVWIYNVTPKEAIPRWSEYRAAIKKDVRWFYHWARDFDRGEMYDVVRELWPDPWAVELMSDLKLDPEFVRELYASHFGDVDNPWSGTLALWAAGYTNDKKQKKNETESGD